MKFGRLALGVLVILVTLWIILGEQLSGATSDATINARLVTLRTPVAGEVALPPRGLGARIDTGETVATIRDALADDMRLDDLEMELAMADAAIAHLTAVADESRTLMADLQMRADVYRAERIAEIETRLEHARARLALLEASVVPDSADRLPVPGPDATRPPPEPPLPALWASHARQEVATLEIALRAAQAGVFLGDGFNDAPHAEQRLTDLRAEAAAQAAAQAEAQARRAAIAQRIAAERRRVNRLAGGELGAPVTGRFWEVLAADGEHVQRGDPVARLLDCGSVIVTASVTEAVFNSLSVGDAVAFRPRGGREVLAGSVERLAGAGAATVYRNLAIAPSQSHLQRFDLAISVPGLRGHPELDCAVGRTGRVFFSDRPLDRLRDLFR